MQTPELVKICAKSVQLLKNLMKMNNLSVQTPKLLKICANMCKYVQLAKNIPEQNQIGMIRDCEAIYC